ncbi:hypothetical protein [Williamsia herbipolensis]|uniref:hypothetical protein n=1 Tax=Williamsia herbipolensis TaxID=1603258 RepID=UPI0005F76AF2|nr:hypothetical protein [Williamsia herbipolensis]
MTDPVDTSRASVTSSQPPKRARVALSDLALIVRPAGRPAAVQAFTAAEAEDARRYAAAMGAEVEPLAGA